MQDSLSVNSQCKNISFRKGIAAGWPICMGYVPIGMAFGVMAQKAGMSPLEIGLMSIIVFAGSSQFIAASMISSGASPFSIIVTTFFVNLRHLLMSSALSVYFPESSKRFLSAFAYGVTDESFAVNLSRFKNESWDPSSAITVNQSANIVWFFSTVTGGIGGQFIPQGAFGIDYALPAMFICLLVYQLNGRIYTIIGILSGILAVALALLIPGNLYVVIASVISAAIGAYMTCTENEETNL